MPDSSTRALPGHLAQTPIRLIVADIDGCLSRGTGHAFSHKLLAELAEANLASETDVTVPAITLCTGRPQPYVECMLQAIHGRYPALCESGTVFFDPVTHTIAMHPDFDDHQEKLLSELRCKVEQRLGKPNVKPEPGKISHITLIIQPPDTPAAMLPEAQEIVSEFGDHFVVEESTICLHFLFRNIHKGVGLKWLARQTGIPQQQMAGIGDAAPDIPFLREVGFAFAPANAQPAVKEICHHVSEKSDALAASEMLKSIVAHNRQLHESGMAFSSEVKAG